MKNRIEIKFYHISSKKEPTYVCMCGMSAHFSAACEIFNFAHATADFASNCILYSKCRVKNTNKKLRPWVLDLKTDIRTPVTHTHMHTYTHRDTLAHSHVVENPRTHLAATVSQFPLSQHLIEFYCKLKEKENTTKILQL